MNYVNLDKTKAFDKLSKQKPFDIRTGLSKARIEKSSISEAGSLVFNYGALPVDEKIIDTLQELAQEQELIEK
ncbi:MAG: glucose-6-phosphate isomerase, partial [Sphaerochaetaceae bacterium]|nr:glucose-6-phosphate isomerase [Sphaerochaetaceae bacterium]